MSEQLKTSELLRKAADEIRRRGWHQGWYGSSAADPMNCSVCAAGAIVAAELGDPYEMFTADYHKARGYLWRIVGGVSVWNDDPRRTVEEVLDVFEKAAVAAELEES